MKKIVKNSLSYHFIYDYLFLLLESCGNFIKEDEILSNAIEQAYNRVNDILSAESCGDILEQYVVTVYGDDEE